MSARAASRLESLGFTVVFDYAAGKQDWLAHGLPYEGTQAEIPHAGAMAHYDVPTCALDDRIGAVRQQADAAGHRLAIVLNDAAVVLGLLSGDQFEAADETRVDVVMEAGPKTFRPHTGLRELLDDMHRHGREHAVITTSDGQLLGIVWQSEAKRLNKKPRAVAADHAAGPQAP